MNATGRTVEEVRARIVDQLWAPGGDRTPDEELLSSSAPQMQLVIEGLDAAHQPEALVTDLLGPLVGRGGRVLLALRRPATPALQAAVAVPLTATLRERLDRLDAAVAELDGAEVRAEELARRIGSLPTLPARAVRRRLDIATLRRDLGVPATDLAAVAADVAALERAVGRQQREQGALLDALQELTEEPDERPPGGAEQLVGLLTEYAARAAADDAAVTELRGLLEAYAARAADGGVAEDEALGGLLRSAARLLRLPYDLSAARRAVEAYVAAVRAEIERRRRNRAEPL